MSGETGGLTAEEREALGCALAPLLDDDSSGPLEWHGCKPTCGPCACSGIPYLGPEMAAAVERIVAARVGDQAATLARVEALADEWEAECSPIGECTPARHHRRLRAALRPGPNPEAT